MENLLTLLLTITHPSFIKTAKDYYCFSHSFYPKIQEWNALMEMSEATTSM